VQLIDHGKARLVRPVIDRRQGSQAREQRGGVAQDATNLPTLSISTVVSPRNSLAAHALAQLGAQLALHQSALHQPPAAARLLLRR
jgi:hypothetical protein